MTDERGENEKLPEPTGGGPLGQEAMFDLMAYADGELEGEARERVEAWIARDPEAARYVDEFRTLSECVVVTEGARRVPKIVDRIVDDVMVKVSMLDPEPAKHEPKVVRMRRAMKAGAVSAVLAIAAAWFLFFRAPPASEGTAANAPAGTPSIEVPAGSSASAPADPVPEQLAANAPPSEFDPPPGDVELEQVEVESPQREISVFYVPGVTDESGSSIVVWVGDNNKPAKPGAK